MGRIHAHIRLRTRRRQTISSDFAPCVASEWNVTASFIKKPKHRRHAHITHIYIHTLTHRRDVYYFSPSARSAYMMARQMAREPPCVSNAPCDGGETVKRVCRCLRVYIRMCVTRMECVGAFVVVRARTIPQQLYVRFEAQAQNLSHIHK